MQWMAALLVKQHCPEGKNPYPHGSWQYAGHTPNGECHGLWLDSLHVLGSSNSALQFLMNDVRSYWWWADQQSQGDIKAVPLAGASVWHRSSQSLAEMPELIGELLSTICVSRKLVSQNPWPTTKWDMSGMMWGRQDEKRGVSLRTSQEFYASETRPSWGKSPLP